MSKILATEEIVIDRTESNFDKACDTASYQATYVFGIDDCGHSNKVKEWERSNCWIEVQFIKYIKMGNSYLYYFVARAIKNEHNK